MEFISCKERFYIIGISYKIKIAANAVSLHYADG